MRSCVYLSDSIAPMFAAWCQQNEELLEERGLVIEINTNVIDENMLLPDEDFLRFALGQQNRMLSTDPSDILETMMMNANLWKQSLATLGTCAHLGEITKDAISRVALFDRDPIHLSRFDNSVNPIAFQLMSTTHRENVAFLFDGTPPSAPETFFDGKRIIPPGDPEYASLVESQTRELIAHRSRTVEVTDYDGALQIARRRNKTQRRRDRVAASG